MMISPLEIGIALSAGLLVLGYVSTRPKPQPVRIRSRDRLDNRRRDA
ncbi:hypothetical protein GVN24_21775 [Rhizobium sp. CRIBSB]|nr:hypothetical protein [Rhizobium sp. CRIBSB]